MTISVCSNNKIVRNGPHNVKPKSHKRRIIVRHIVYLIKRKSIVLVGRNDENGFCINNKQIEERNVARKRINIRLYDFSKSYVINNAKIFNSLVRISKISMCNTSPSGRDFDVLEKSLDIESSIFFTIRTDVDKTCYSCFFF